MGRGSGGMARPGIVDRHGTILVHAWPGAEHRDGGRETDVLGRRPVSVGADGRRGGAEGAREERWSVGRTGELLIDGSGARRQRG